MEAIALEKIAAHDAASVMRAAGLGDASRQYTAESVAEKGQAFKLSTAGGEGVFVVELRGIELWVHGAGGVASSGLTAPGLAVIEALARSNGCVHVAFQTARPGLVKLAKKSGYRVVGFIMEKSV